MLSADPAQAADARAMASRLTETVSTMQSPVSSGGDNRHARAELEGLVMAAPDTESGIAARYLLGRLRQLEDGVLESPEFTVLLNEHPQHLLAQLAAVKLMLRRLYADGAEKPEDRLQMAEQLGGRLTVPALRCDYHLALGEAYIFYGDRQEPALRHLRAAEVLGIPSAAARANVLVQIGELARLTGDRATAVQSYRKFLTNFPRDLRQQIVRDRLTELGEASP